MRELYIVEGDSALTSCKLGRDAEFQAIIPVRGKTLNCMKSFWGSSFRRRTVPLDETLPTEDNPSDGSMESYLRRLPEQYRAVIHLFYYEDLPTAEIARLLRRRETTGRVQLMRARQILREMMEKEDG